MVPVACVASKHAAIAAYARPAKQWSIRPAQPKSLRRPAPLVPLRQAAKLGFAPQRSGRGEAAVMSAASTSEAQIDVPKIFKRLQNGSDIRGVALEGVPDQPVNLTEGRAFFIGAAFAKWLKANLPSIEGDADRKITVSIGTDPRLSGGDIAGALTAGLYSQGVQVTIFGLATTPAMFMSTITEAYSFSGAIMITASHLPFNRNGMKFFTAQGGLEKKDITAILDFATSLCLEVGGDPDSMDKGMDALCGENSVADYNQINFMRVYAEQLRNLIKLGVSHPERYDEPLKDLRIVVDAGNGSGGFFAEEVLQPLGADITGSQFLEPDGRFPNHIPNPEEPAAMEATTKAVLENNADLGICFDTDVDRSGVVDKTGKQINSNAYIALMAAITLADYPGSTIVTDSVTSIGLAKFITDLGGKHFRYRRGYKNVISKGVELNEEGEQCELMMETSGHGAMKENFFLDDGAYSAVKVIIEVVRRRLEGKSSISEMLSSLPEALESREYRLKINADNFQEVGKGVLDAFHDKIVSGAYPEWSLEEVNHEGWRVNIDEGDGKVGWALIRQSLHDPLLVLNVESELECGATVTAMKVHDFLQEMGFDNIDASSLTLDSDVCVKSGGADWRVA